MQRIQIGQRVKDTDRVERVQDTGYRIQIGQRIQREAC
jgi:hypothetical protein